MSDKANDPPGKTTRAAGGDWTGDGGTALARYQHLESTGIWRSPTQDQAREVAARLGRATLTLIDIHSGIALGHWSLPAIRRLPGGGREATFAPGRDSGESLTLSDPDMIAALYALESAVRAATPRRGRLRGLLLAGAALVAAAALAYALPGMVAGYAAGKVPASLRAEIGQHLLEGIEGTAGPSCTGRQGLAALARLSEHMFGPADTPILLVLRGGLTRPLHLPGGLILLPESLLDEAAPQALAGAALVENLAARDDDPMRALLAEAGLRASLSLLMTGELADAALDDYGAGLLGRQAPELPATERLAAVFAQAGVPLLPYLQWRARLAGEVQPATDGAEADLAGMPDWIQMPDNDWMALQSLCTG